jgi:hypothetical protein
MDLSRAVTEPLKSVVAFHDQFNHNVKLTFGALAYVGAQHGVAGQDQAPHVILPTGGEPWRATDWRDLQQSIKDAASFITELGLVRAASAFEDYLTGAKAELDRAASATTTGAGDEEGALARLIRLLGIDVAAMADLSQMVRFFDVARNCVVHRSGRASKQLAEIALSASFAATLRRWPRRTGKWQIGVPDVREGAPVEWRPRHAIMASDVYFRCALEIDRAVVQRLGEIGIVNMAAYWCLLTENPRPCQASRSPETMIRTQLMTRYRARKVGRAEPVAFLRDAGRWSDVRTAFARRTS